MLGRRVTSPSHLATTNCLIVFTRCWSMPELMFRSLRRGESSSFDVAKRGEQSATVVQPGALHAPHSPKTGRTMQSKGSPVRIVYIVDDDPALLGSLERTFRAAGLTAVSYQTAFAFLDAAPNFNDQALLDAVNAALALDRGPTRDRESVVAAKLMVKLSPRERQVLDGLVAGRSTKLMAYDFGISARTVEVHRARMLARLGTHSLAEAIRLAGLAGLSPADLDANAADGQRLSGVSRGLPE